MESVKVQKKELLGYLEKNRNGHREQFLLAQAGWRETLIEELDRQLEHARNGRSVKSTFHVPEPEDHTDDYDRVILMVEMSVDDVIEIPEHDFSQYVMDDWAWKANWGGSNKAYISRVT